MGKTRALLLLWRRTMLSTAAWEEILSAVELDAAAHAAELEAKDKRIAELEAEELLTLDHHRNRADAAEKRIAELSSDLKQARLACVDALQNLLDARMQLSQPAKGVVREISRQEVEAAGVGVLGKRISEMVADDAQPCPSAMRIAELEAEHRWEDGRDGKSK